MEQAIIFFSRMDAAMGKTTIEEKETSGTRVKFESLQEEKVYRFYMKMYLYYSPKTINIKWTLRGKKLWKLLGTERKELSCRI